MPGIYVTMNIGRRGHVRIRRMVNNRKVELSPPVPCEIVHQGPRKYSVKLLGGCVFGWRAGDTYRCMKEEFVPDVPRIGDDAVWFGPAYLTPTEATAAGVLR